MSVTPFSHYRVDDVLSSLEVLVEKIRAGHVPAERVIVCIETPEGEIDYKVFGSNPFTRLHSVGILEWVKNLILDIEP